MKRFVAALLSCSLVLSIPSTAGNYDINQYAKQTEDVHSAGQGGSDSLYTGISLSMLGWGVALFTTFALIAFFVSSNSGTVTTTKWTSPFSSSFKLLFS